MKLRNSKLQAVAGIISMALAIAGCSTRSDSALKLIQGRATAQPSSPGASGTSGGRALKFTAPADWLPETPTSSMRRAQYRLARVAGDPEDGELAVFFFEGQGGSVQMNLDRWIGQFQTPQGTRAKGQVSRRQVHGLSVTIVDVSGTYLQSSGPMMSPTGTKPGFRMLAAVAETPDGPWFFKLTGPAKTVMKWAPSFQSFLDTLE